MSFGPGGTQRKEIALPVLSKLQLKTVAGTMGAVLQLTFMAYGEALGPQRIEEMEEFGKRLLIAIKNGELSGLPMHLEPAIVEAVYAITAANIPEVKRQG